MKPSNMMKILMIGSIFLLATSAIAAEGALKIAAASGKVMVMISPAAEWSDAQQGQVLSKKDGIKTAEDGVARLEFPDTSSVTLKENTEVSVEELVWEEAAKTVGINMTAGQLKVLIKTPSDFKVKTPAAICGARGTVFYIFIEGADTRVYVDEGSVDFTSTISGDSYVVIQGMESIASVTGEMSQPRKLTGDEKAAVLAGWETGPIAELYTEPEVSNQDNLGDMSQQEMTQENPAQENKASRI
ncbi:MAG: FecR family protein [Candidatus Omnitrophica bacterium]|nr:FecR family protein [Candidatus Omnitrophota bacterium]MCM8791024.1 FecR family protein [Candidatus Omnitrophota bacterium]